MRWPLKGRPEMYKRGRWWIVRWFDPTTKQCRAYRTRHEQYAVTFMKGLT